MSAASPWTPTSPGSRSGRSRIAPGIAAQVFGPLADVGINVDTIVQNASVERLTDLTFSVAHGQAARAFEVVQGLAADLDVGQVILDEHLAKVSIVGTGMQSGVGYASTMFRVLADVEINIELITTSEIRITAVVHEDVGEKAVRALHAAFELDQPVLERLDGDYVSREEAVAARDQAQRAIEHAQKLKRSAEEHIRKRQSELGEV